MKVLAVCGFGVGSSMILRMTAEKVFKELGVDADVEATDVSTAQGSSADLILTSYELAENLKGQSTPVIPIKHYTNSAEVKEAVEKWLKDKGE